MNSGPVISYYDDSDVQYLVEQLDINQLQHELSEAETKAMLRDHWLGTPYEEESDKFPWLDIAQWIRQALELKRANQKEQPKLQFSGEVDSEAIKAKHDIVSVIERYTKLKKVANNFIGCCPIHLEKHPSLNVYHDQQSWWCFGCNRGGDIFDFIMLAHNCDFRSAARVLEAI